MKKLFSKINWKISKSLNWLNGFSFRFFVVFSGIIIGSLIIIVIFFLLIFWIFFSSDQSFKDLKKENIN